MSDRTEIALRDRDRNKVKVRRILRITNAINENRPAKYLFEIFKDILMNDLEIEHIAFFTKSGEDWSLSLGVDVDEKLHELDVEANLGQFRDITSLGIVSNNSLEFFDLVIPILHKEKPLGFLLLKDIEEEDEASVVSNLIKNLNYIQSLANIILAALENKRLAKNQMAQELLKRELLLAERIQKALLPGKLPSNEWMNAIAYHQSHGHVGGDFYDLIETAPGIYYICMADISGKGISAALLMSNFQAAFKATVRQNLSLQSLIQELNQIVLESSQGDKFITAFIGKYDSKNHELEYVNCAHPPAILFNDKMTTRLRPDIPGLGMLTKVPYFEPETYTLSPNTFLATYTDGIAEFENEMGEQFGEDRLVDSLNAFKGKPLNTVIDHVSKDIEDFAGKQAATDDIAALIIEFL